MLYRNLEPEREKIWNHSFNLRVLHIFIVFRSNLISFHSSSCVLIDRYKATVITFFSLHKAYLCICVEYASCILHIVSQKYSRGLQEICYLYSLLIIQGFFSKCVDSVQILTHCNIPHVPTII